MDNAEESEVAITFEFEGVTYVVVIKGGLHSVRLTRERWDLGGFVIDDHRPTTVWGWFKGRILAR